MYKIIDYPDGEEVGTIMSTVKDQTAAFFLADKCAKGNKREVYYIGDSGDVLVYRTKGR